MAFRIGRKFTRSWPIQRAFLLTCEEGMPRKFHSPVTRLIALLAIVALLPWPGLLRAATSNDDLCDLHGRSCECAEMCKREKERHPPKPVAPSCHRDAKPPAAETTKPKDGCRMTSCGPGAPDGVQSSHHPSTPALAQYVPVSLVVAERTQRVPPVTMPLLFASPPHPPPKV